MGIINLDFICTKTFMIGNPWDSNFSNSFRVKDYGDSIIIYLFCVRNVHHIAKRKVFIANREFEQSQTVSGIFQEQKTFEFLIGA